MSAAIPHISKNAAKRAAKQAAREALKLQKRGGLPAPPTDLLPSVDKHARDCRRFKVLLQYDGGGFHGWLPQHPPGREPLRTVGGTVEVAFRTVLQQRVRVCPAGRTDAGVSAVGQVCQFDAIVSEPASTADDLVPRLNAELPPDVRVRDIQVVSSNFAAMSNLWKRYVYTIPPRSSCTSSTSSTSSTNSTTSTTNTSSTAPSVEDGQQEKLLNFCRKVMQNSGSGGGISESSVTRLDLAMMQRAARALEGTHDFASFQSKGGRKTTVRTLHRCAIKPVTRSAATGGTSAAGRGSASDEEVVGVEIIAEGDGFLYNMVRILAGTLLEVGCGLRTVDETAALVRDTAPADPAGACELPRGVQERKGVPGRSAAGPTLPAAGLCLEHVEYERPWGESTRCSSPFTVGSGAT